MRSRSSKWFECEDGHITAGDTRKEKCGAETWQLDYVKGKRKGSWKTELKPTGPCEKKIIEQGDIPSKMDYKTVWDYKVMHAFLIGQKFDAEFIIELQNNISDLHNRLQRIEDAGRTK